MLSRFARWEKCLLAAVVLAGVLLLVRYMLPHQKLFAARVKHANRALLANQLQRGSATFTGEELRKVIDSLRNSERVPPWHKVDAVGGYEFQFFRGSNHLASVRAAPGVFWCAGTAYIDRSPNLGPLFERVRKTNSQAEDE